MSKLLPYITEEIAQGLAQNYPSISQELTNILTGNPAEVTRFNAAAIENALGEIGQDIVVTSLETITEEAMGDLFIAFLPEILIGAKAAEIIDGLGQLFNAATKTDPISIPGSEMTQRGRAKSNPAGGGSISEGPFNAGGGSSDFDERTGFLNADELEDVSLNDLSERKDAGDDIDDVASGRNTNFGNDGLNRKIIGGAIGSALAAGATGATATGVGSTLDQKPPRFPTGTNIPNQHSNNSFTGAHQESFAPDLEGRPDDIFGPPIKNPEPAPIPTPVPTPVPTPKPTPDQDEDQEDPGLPKPTPVPDYSNENLGPSVGTPGKPHNHGMHNPGEFGDDTGFDSGPLPSHPSSSSSGSSSGSGTSSGSSSSSGSGSSSGSSSGSGSGSGAGGTGGRRGGVHPDEEEEPISGHGDRRGGVHPLDPDPSIQNAQSFSVLKKKFTTRQFRPEFKVDMTEMSSKIDIDKENEYFFHVYNEERVKNPNHKKENLLYLKQKEMHKHRYNNNRSYKYIDRPKKNNDFIVQAVHPEYNRYPQNSYDKPYEVLDNNAILFPFQRELLI